jgi:hypothetical protein
LEVGLPEAIKIMVKGWQHFQQLDYEQLPFKCRHCHEYGHFQRHCPKLQEPKTGKGSEEGWQQMKKQKANPRRKGSKVSEPPAKAPPTKDPNPSKGQKEIQISNSGNSFASLEEQEPPDKDLLTHLGEGSANPLGEGSQVKGTMNVESSYQQDKEDPYVEMESEEGSEEDDTKEDDIDQKKSIKKDKRGRKIDKEIREAATYRDKLVGVQSTMKKHLNPINTRHQGNAARGAASNPKGK